jgi:hypothetical protein
MRKEDRHHILISRLILFVLSSALVLTVVVQITVGQRRNRPRPRATIDYSRFSHATQKHRQTCNTCHKVPTENWRKASAFPDVADYPDHDACVSCHRPQFFRGARPVICTNCHTQVAPRADTRFVFRNPKVQTQFTIEFPHDRHQDVIARAVRIFGEPIFVKASFSAVVQDAKSYNNCTICHQSRPVVSALTWLDGYVPDALTFKNAPVDHSSCFNCHWKAQKPVRDNCDGCHKLAEKPITDASVPVRISMKFKHDGGGEKRNHVAECTTCHINITKSETLRGLKPDVPLTSCSECHNKDGLRLDVAGELAKVDKNREFVCSYCHTSEVGRRDAPASHYLISGREPKTRKELE